MTLACTVHRDLPFPCTHPLGSSSTDHGPWHAQTGARTAQRSVGPAGSCRSAWACHHGVIRHPPVKYEYDAARLTVKAQQADERAAGFSDPPLPARHAKITFTEATATLPAVAVRSPFRASGNPPILQGPKSTQKKKLPFDIAEPRPAGAVLCPPDANSPLAGSRLVEPEGERAGKNSARAGGGGRRLAGMEASGVGGQAVDAYRKALATAASGAAYAVMARGMARELLPPELRAVARRVLSALSARLGVGGRERRTLVVRSHQAGGREENLLFDAARTYLASRLGPRAMRGWASRWTAPGTATAAPAGGGSSSSSPGTSPSTSSRGSGSAGPASRKRKGEPGTSGDRDFVLELSFDADHTDVAMDRYVPFVMGAAEEVEQRDRELKICMNEGRAWYRVSHHHPATFDTLAMDPALKRSIVADLDLFASRRDHYRRIGKAWKRGYLLYGPPGTGKSSLAAAMANHLRYDLFDLDLNLSHVNMNNSLQWLLVGMSNCCLDFSEMIGLTDGTKDEALRSIKLAKSTFTSGDRQAEKFDILNSATYQGKKGRGQACENPKTPKESVGHVNVNQVYTEENIRVVQDIRKKKDYYAVLGVERRCSVEEIRKAYRRLSLKVHPDKNKAPGAEDAFKSVSKAFKCLSNDQSWKTYDQTGTIEDHEFNEQYPNTMRRGMARRRTQARRSFNNYEEDFDPDEIFMSFFYGSHDNLFCAQNTYRARGTVRQQQQRTEHTVQGGSGINLTVLVHLTVVLIIVSLAFIPVQRPEYSLQKTYYFPISKVTQKHGVYFVSK
ncbi:chaperone protein dnaJ 49-like [Panicum miliaceum]|uniref:Chaperone protein dnaJ 49-like n=1 Tax=Panicum miliaceum TaxID=4540 RepID=A0A3L6R7K3_PANMI|nr:chaperone protein dnaJ 49-like [Panicum miliaceum]